MKKFNRKPLRLKNYDYSTNGYYFITICTHNKQNLFGKINLEKEAKIELNQLGIIVDEHIQNIEEIDNYIIMPNHLHMILRLEHDTKNKSIPRIINGFKGSVTKRIGKPIWQKSYHDHIIRDEKGYESIWDYVEHNAERWRDDTYYIS